MSVSLLLDANPKPWANLKCNNLDASGNVTVTGTIKGVAAPVSRETLTAGTNVILAAGILSGIQQITGAAASDTGANIDLAFPSLVVGDVVKCLVLNDAATASAITAGSGNTLGVTNFEVPIKASRLIYFRKTATGAYTMY